MKHLLVIALALPMMAQQQGKVCKVPPEESAKYHYLTSEKFLYEAMEFMDRYWSVKLKLADLRNVSNAEWKQLLKDAPRMIGDGKTYWDHYWSRAESTAAEGKKVAAEQEAFRNVLINKYGTIRFGVDGKLLFACKESSK